MDNKVYVTEQELAILEQHPSFQPAGNTPLGDTKKGVGVETTIAELNKRTALGKTPENCTHPRESMRLESLNRYSCDDCGAKLRTTRTTVLKRRRLLR